MLTQRAVEPARAQVGVDEVDDAEALSGYDGNGNLSFSFNSMVTGTTYAFASVNETERENRIARIWGGMHFRTALVHCAVLGAKTARWVEKHHFTPLP